MTTDQLLSAWGAWLKANPDEPADVLLQRLHRIAIEQRRPSAQPQRRKMFKRGR